MRRKIVGSSDMQNILNCRDVVSQGGAGGDTYVIDVYLNGGSQCFVL